MNHLHWNAFFSILFIFFHAPFSHSLCIGGATLQYATSQQIYDHIGEKNTFRTKKCMQKIEKLSQQIYASAKHDNFFLSCRWAHIFFLLLVVRKTEEQQQNTERKKIHVNKYIGGIACSCDRADGKEYTPFAAQFEYLYWNWTLKFAKDSCAVTTTALANCIQKPIELLFCWN